MVSSPWGYLLYVLPNLLVGLSYLLFLKQPLKVRLLAALPSLLFLLVFPLGFLLGILEIACPVMIQLSPWVLSIFGIAASALVIRNLIRLRTWLNVLQIPNVAMGYLLLFVAYLIVSGAG